MAADLPPTTPDAAPATAVVAPAPAAAAPIYVDANGYRYAVSGNTLLPREAIEAALRDVAGPKEAVDALNLAFQKAGYLLVVMGAEVNNKLVAIRVLQGRVAEVDAPEDIKRFLRSIEGREDLTRRMLLQETTMVDAYASRQGVRPKAAFAKSEVVGGTKLTVTEEPIPGAKPWNAAVAFGNLGSRYSSRYTAAASGAVRPGGGLELTAAYTQGLPGMSADSSGSSYKAVQLGSSLITPWGLYAVSLSKTQYTIGEFAAPLYPSGDIETAAFNGTQLVYADEATRLAVTESLTRVSNTQSVFDGLQTIVDQNYNVAALGATYNRSFALAGQNGSIGAGITVLQGFSPRSGSFLPVGDGVPNPRFTSIQANASVAAGLPAGFTAGATLSGQYSDDTLPQNQQWVAGGLGNLSAWLPAVLIGDTGALARLSVTSPPYRWGEFGISGAAFAEAGFSRFSYRPVGDPTTRALADAGLSVSGTTSFGTNVTLAYAWPVWYRNVEGAARNVADQARANLYFTLNQSF
jgi:hemolysin activation/secretion protein